MKKFLNKSICVFGLFCVCFLGIFNIPVQAYDLKLNLEDLNPKFAQYIKNLEGGNIPSGNKDNQFLGLMPSMMEFKKDYKGDYEDKSLTNNGKNMSSLPAKYKGVLTPIKNQGSYGSCWACAFASVAESSILKSFEDLVAISPVNMVYNLNWGASLNNPYAFDADEGGTNDMAPAYFASGRGTVLEDIDKYDKSFDKSDNEHWNVKKRQFVDTKLKSLNDLSYYVTGMSFIPNADIYSDNYEQSKAEHLRKVKRAIMNYGSVWSTFCYDPEYISDDKKSYCFKCSDEEFSWWIWPNHAISIVGWDDNYSRMNFKHRPKKDGAFIVKNSWGEDWGENGLFYMSYEDIFAGNDAMAITKIDDFKDKYLFNRIYQRDYFGMQGGIPTGKKEVFEAKIFNLRDSHENLTDVGVFIANSEVNCEFYLGELDSENKIVGLGDQIGEQCFEFPGYYVVPLSNVKKLDKEKNNGKFAIIVKMASDEEILLPVEINCALWCATSKAKGNKNENFINMRGEGWEDIYDTFNEEDSYEFAHVTNLNIKAFTEK